MAVETNKIKRGGKEYNATEGLNPAGKTRCKIEDVEPHPVHEQKIKRAPIKIEIFLDEGELNGEVYRIQTIWKTAMVSNGNKPLHGGSTTETMISSPENTDEFTSQFAAALKFIINGYVRADLNGNQTGWNDMPVYVVAPVYETDGVTIKGYAQVLATYSEEEENKPADNKYYNPTPPTE